MSANGKASNAKMACHTDVVRLKTEVSFLKQMAIDKEELLREIIKTQDMLAKKVIGYELEQKYQGEQLQDLKKDTKIQNKILWTILTAIIGGAIKILFHL